MTSTNDNFEYLEVTWWNGSKKEKDKEIQQFVSHKLDNDYKYYSYVSRSLHLG